MGNIAFSSMSPSALSSEETCVSPPLVPAKDLKNLVVHPAQIRHLTPNSICYIQDDIGMYLEFDEGISHICYKILNAPLSVSDSSKPADAIRLLYYHYTIYGIYDGDMIKVSDRIAFTEHGWILDH